MHELTGNLSLQINHELSLPLSVATRSWPDGRSSDVVDAAAFPPDVAPWVSTSVRRCPAAGRE